MDKQTETLRASGEKRTALVVEDNEMNREILCALLEDDYNVVEAENGQVGLDRLAERSGDFSVILLDVFMPVLDGFGFLARKREDPRFDAIPVIVMTASDTVDDEIRCLELGATDFVTKPYNVEVLKNRMQSVIRLRESATMLNRLELDSLTKLYSKEFFYHNVEELLKANPQAKFDVVCSDVENFRSLNERYGQPQCDKFLQYLASSIPQALPGYLIGGRIGPDVFGFLIEHQEGDWTAALHPVSQEGQSSVMVVKYGILPDLPRDVAVSTACDRATLALNRIKGRYNLNVAWYNDELRQLQQLESQIVSCMQTSLARREFQVYYQPKHDLRADRTGGAEALVRWNHPELGFISPGLFIPLFEQNGFVTQLDFYIWEEVCRELKRFRELGLPQVPISINASRLDFDVPDLAEKIVALADKYGVDHALLHVELTESLYGDNPESIERTLRLLHDNGFIIELDDFGSGYSSLTSLNTLPLDVLKLDMSLIRQAAATGDYSIMRFAVLLADGMRMKTVVEGVEFADQVEAMKVLGCDYIQGNYFSRPIPAAEFEDYVSVHGRR